MIVEPITTYKSMVEAYDLLNSKLFNNELPACLITLQRTSKALGYFSADKFENKANNADIFHEIALNPSTFQNRTSKEILSTLAHEMTHLWQNENGKPSRNGYHNQQWAAKMVSFGLIPSNTGQEGGKQTGQKMTHYIDDNGLFNKIVEPFLLKNNTTLYQDRTSELQKKKAKKQNKIKYTCPTCGVNAWGKPELYIKCGEDEMRMEVIV